MKPLGQRLPVTNTILLVIFILGILWIALLAPSYRAAAPLKNGSPSVPFALPNLTLFQAEQPEANLSEEIPATAAEITPVVTPTPVPTPEVSMISGPGTPKRNVTPFVASLIAINPAPVSMPADLMPIGSRHEYRDNNRKQVVTVSVRNFDAASEYRYHFEDITVPDIITVRAKKGNRFFFVEVSCDLIGIVGEGKRTTFMTPAVSSYRLVNRGTSYQPVEPDSIEDILQDAIINVGTLAREEPIDKDNPARGVLIYEVPIVVTARESYIEFCPHNTLNLSQPHSPEWDCEQEAVRWSLVPLRA